MSESGAEGEGVGGRGGAEGEGEGGRDRGRRQQSRQPSRAGTFFVVSADAAPAPALIPERRRVPGGRRRWRRTGTTSPTSAPRRSAWPTAASSSTQPQPQPPPLPGPPPARARRRGARRPGRSGRREGSGRAGSGRAGDGCSRGRGLLVLVGRASRKPPPQHTHTDLAHTRAQGYRKPPCGKPTPPHGVDCGRAAPCHRGCGKCGGKSALADRASPSVHAIAPLPPSAPRCLSWPLFSVSGEGRLRDRDLGYAQGV
jgi:hypothetical protein